ncbi:retrovirus-related pol polyprotein from transposon TNT 1-94, partial [Tanacetum coccineum]
VRFRVGSEIATPTLCYPTNDSEDLEKMKPKANIEIFIGYSPSKKAYRIYNKRTILIMETIHVQTHARPGCSTSAKPSIKNDCDLLFQTMFDEYFKPPSVVSITNFAVILTLPDRVGASSSTTINQDAPSLSTSPNKETTASPIDSTNVKQQNNEKDAEFDSDTFTNPFSPLITSFAKSSSRILDTSNMHTFQQPHINTKRWTKDHPLVTIIGNPSKPSKNYKEAMKESYWIKAMQEEIHEFERLKVWELVLKPSNVMLINLKWIFNVKLDEYGGVLKNKGYQPDGFVDQDHLNHVLRLKKALYGLKQAPRVWYDMLSKFLLSQKFIKGLQVSQNPRGIFINQSKYYLEMLKKFGLEQCNAVDILIVERSKLDEDPNGNPVDPTRYRSMVGSLMYLTASRSDLVFFVCMCDRYQSKPTEKHLTAVKQVFRYLKGTINMGLWYPKDTRFDLTAFAYADHKGCQDSRRSTSGSAQFFREKLISWSSKKQKCTAISTTEANKIPLYYDSKSAIALSCNTVQHSRMKHIAVRYHFIKEQVENEVVELYFVKTAYQLSDIFTKTLTTECFKFLINLLVMQSITPKELKHLAETDED